jgi:ABC-type lipoprotein export system ATPase subunit
LIVSLENISLKYFTKNGRLDVLENFNLQVNEGEFISIVGSSGSGKTTILNLISGFIKPQKGKVRIKTQDLGSLVSNELADLRLNSIGFIFQKFYLFPKLNALQNISLPMRLKGIKMNASTERALELMTILKCDHKSQSYPPELSAGEQQRVAIARALANDPPLILADELTGNLDEDNVHSVLNILRDINKEGKTIILATHDDRLVKNSSRVITLGGDNVI